MTVTPIGLVVIPLSLAVFLLAPNLLVPWAILTSVFQAASVVNVGGDFPFGIAPFFFVVLLIAVRLVPQYLTGRFGFAQGDPILILSRPVVLFVLWGVASAFVLPFLFVNVTVNVPRGGMDIPAVPLHWSMSNAAQAGYLVLDCLFLMYTTRLARDRWNVERIVSAFRWGGAIAVAVLVYQLAVRETGLPYPREFFNSNDAWAQLLTEKIGGTWRLSSTFTEPSAAGIFFAAWSVFLLVGVSHQTASRRLDWILLSSGIASLILTTSSTGYIVAAVVLSLFVLQQILRLVVQGKVNPRVLIVCSAVGLAAIVAIALIPDFDRVVQAVVFQKSESISAKARTATQWQSLVIAAKSSGLGVGLGSNRPSGMLFYVLSNLGIPGLLLFTYCLYLTFSLMRGFRQPELHSIASGYSAASAWAFMTTILAMVVAGAEVTTPQLWITWSLTAATMSHVWTPVERMSESRDRELLRAQCLPAG